MKIHHIDCGCMCPLGRRMLSGSGSHFERGRLPAHCLLIETPSSGLILVDTGFGLADIERPMSRLGPAATMLGTPRRTAITAYEQVKQLGHSPRDVRHIVVTHLDLDHAGGLPDFPWAKIHVHTRERSAAESPTLMERERYRKVHFAHRPDYAVYDVTGEPWNGFPAVRDLPGLPPEILAIPLPGHTRGHACIAVNRGDRWLLHAGDSYFHRSRITGGETPTGLWLFERIIAVNYEQVQDNHRRLAELAARTDLEIFSAHDPSELEAAQRGQLASTPEKSSATPNER